MDFINDYVKWRGDLDFSQAKFNEIDAAIFSYISLINFDTFLPNYPSIEKIKTTVCNHYLLREVKKGYNYIGLIIPNMIIPLFDVISKKKRYEKLFFGNYINKINKNDEIQFSALTIEIDADTIAVVFSATDDTIIGWKENFNMLFQPVTSGQTAALDYFKHVTKDYKNIYVMGHSKGGNLSLYTFLNIDDELRNRVVCVYDFDGPGLNIQKEDYRETIQKNQSKFVRVIPSCSIVGRIFESFFEPTIIESRDHGLYQHDMFGWEVDVDHFKVANSGSQADAIHIENKIKELVTTLPLENQTKFINILYQLINRTDSDTLTELNRRKMKLFNNYLLLDFRTKKDFNKVFSLLIKDPVIRKILFNNLFDFNVKSKEIKKVSSQLNKKGQDIS